MGRECNDALGPFNFRGSDLELMPFHFLMRLRVGVQQAH
jgi:hypothetical protein